MILSISSTSSIKMFFVVFVRHIEIIITTKVFEAFVFF